MTLNLKNIQKMSQEFYDAFIDMFQDAQIRLERLLRLKLRAIQKISNPENVLEYDELHRDHDKFKNFRTTNKEKNTNRKIKNNVSFYKGSRSL